MSFRQGDVSNQVPRSKFIGVNRFSGVVFGEPPSQIVRGTGVRLVGKILAPENVRVVQEARLRLLELSLGILA
jgi:hypothetical protein